MRSIAVAVAVLAIACTGGEGRVTGTVVQVDGDMTTVTAFEVQTSTGRMRFVPGPELIGFVDEDGVVGAPLAHLREHLLDGHPVRVTYRSEGDANLAVLLEDAPAG